MTTETTTTPKRKVRTRLTIEDVRTIRQRYAAGEPQKNLALDYNTNTSNISHIIQGRTWRGRE